MVVRSDGELFYSGKTEAVNDILSFSLSDIQRSETAPTAVNGKLTKSGIELEMIIASRKRKDKRRTSLLKMEDLSKKFPDLSGKSH